jgi:hypothetical protein
MQHAPVNEPSTPTVSDKPSSRSKKTKLDIKKPKSSKHHTSDSKVEGEGAPVSERKKV